jgi:hypothetical protein
LSTGYGKRATHSRRSNKKLTSLLLVFTVIDFCRAPSGNTIEIDDRLLQTARLAAQKRGIWAECRPRAKRPRGFPAGCRTVRRAKLSAVCLAQRADPLTVLLPVWPYSGGQSPSSIPTIYHVEGLFCDDSYLPVEVLHRLQTNSSACMKICSE